LSNVFQRIDFGLGYSFVACAILLFDKTLIEYSPVWISKQYLELCKRSIAALFAGNSKRIWVSDTLLIEMLQTCYCRWI